jgi:hypothetical protein
MQKTTKTLSKHTADPLLLGGGVMRAIGKYLLGKGLFSLGVMVATFSLGSIGLGPALAVAGGFFAWKAYQKYNDFTHEKAEMLAIYREEIVARTGVPAHELSTAHLRQIASGDPLLGIAPNAVIAEALDKQRGTSFLSMLTASLAAVATFTMLQFGLGDVVSTFFTQTFPEFGTLIQKASIGLVSAVSGLILHDGLDAGIGHAMGLSKVTAHERISHIARTHARGKQVEARQIFDVFLASNPKLERQVDTAFNKGFWLFSNKEKTQAMREIGVEALMQQMAQSINDGAMRPATLAFTLDTEHIEAAMREHVEKGETPEKAPEKISPQQLKKPAISGHHQQAQNLQDSAKDSHYFRNKVTHAARSKAQQSFAETQITRRENALVSPSI